MKLPSVTVPITSYNQDEYIQEAVLSAVEQDYDNLKVVVRDDASVDDTQEILRELALKYPKRLEVIINPINLGGGRNRSQSLTMAEGEYICYLDGDDLFLPGKVKIQVEAMLNRPEYAFSYHNLIVFDSKTNETLYYWNDRFRAGDGDVKDLIRYGKFCSSLSIMFRKKDMPAIPYYEEISIGQDWPFFINVLMNGGGKFFYMEQVLAKFRVHEVNQTLQWKKKLESKETILNIIETQYPQFSSGVRQMRSDVYLNKVLFLIVRKKYKQAFSALINSIKYSFPYFWRLLRIPIREGLFLVKTRKMDALLKSLLKKD